ncbi:hypothetical protein F5X99DRAFT_396925 [Biscogniauxia marginata]|nr:hypothetical protein F5X99DRAFT_396925 [Biscogniauxia marginata]
MPPQVISLLSSSPSEPCPIIPKSPKPPKRAGLPKPSRALDYDIFDLTIDGPRNTATASASRTVSQTGPGFKRTTGNRFQHDDDFLFLSDDADTSRDVRGDLTAKRPRLSPGLVRSRMREDLKRTSSAVVSRKTRESIGPARIQRWNSTADPIENSSSPNDRGFAIRKRRACDDIHSDPFASPPGKQMIDLASTKSSREIPFGSPPKRSDSYMQSSTWNWPAELSNPPSNSVGGCNPSKQSSRTSAFMDLSSDPFETSPERTRPKASKKNAAWDPISSSMPEIGADDDVFPTRSPQQKGKQLAEALYVDSLAGSESEDLPELDDIDFTNIASKTRSCSLSPRPKSNPTKEPRKKTTKSGEEKERERKEKAAAREAEKERRRTEKDRAKEQRALAREKDKALAEVNKLRTDKKVSTPEMIVDIPDSLSPGIKVQIDALLGDLDVQHGTWHSRVENVIKWRRKVSSAFNKELGHWVPVPMRIKDENHIMAVIQAPEFVKLALGSDGQDLEAHVLKMKTNFPNTTIVYLIEGLVTWMRKNRNALNRQFASAVRSLDQNGNLVQASSQSRRRNNTQHQEYIDEDSIEDALLSLQVIHGALIHHTNAPVETAQWVAVFTQHISTIPYRKARDASADAGFCMEAGQVRTGDDAKDTYVRMLQEITRVTAPVAYGIAAKYGTVAELVRGLEREGPLALEDCRKSANKDGAFTDRTVGQAASRRVHKIFTSLDPGSTDV